MIDGELDRLSAEADLSRRKACWICTYEPEKFTMLVFSGCGCTTMKTWWYINSLGKHASYAKEARKMEIKPPEGPDIHARLTKEASHVMYPGFYVFALVRNPYARILSKYFDRAREILPWDSFVRQLTVEASVRVPRGDRHFRPLAPFFRAAGIARESIDFMMKLETIDEDFRKVCEALGKEPVTLFNEKAASRQYERPWGSYYTPDQANLIWSAYREDFELFGYDKESWRVGA